MGNKKIHFLALSISYINGLQIYREGGGRSVLNDCVAEGGKHQESLKSFINLFVHWIDTQTQSITTHYSEEEIWEGSRRSCKKFSLSRICAVKGLAGNCGRFCGDYLVKCPV